uniref:Uncharacterized protein n=1 Tax=Oryza meridionalis TaxID=40149 RepID=A0A0E0EF50_9ORYZ
MKKLRKWRMLQEQIDHTFCQIWRRARRRRRRSGSLDADGAEAIYTAPEREQQEWVKAELATHGYVECEIDDDVNPRICGCAHAGHGEDEVEGYEYDGDCGCDDDDNGEDE